MRCQITCATLWSRGGSALQVALLTSSNELLVLRACSGLRFELGPRPRPLAGALATGYLHGGWLPSALGRSEIRVDLRSGQWLRLSADRGQELELVAGPAAFTQPEHDLRIGPAYRRLPWRRRLRARLEWLRGGTAPARARPS